MSRNVRAVIVSATLIMIAIYTAPRSWAERAYPKLLHYDRHDKGGHFAAWEQPEALTRDLREAFRSLR
ncbi:MAG TPA: hypothetical protein VKE51_16665 [Vicinamibacterales bacterium]|nr:hypothetical protein [Vicinamibacterales bacterium]